MTGDDNKKENRWAKVLDEAGLLDDVEDAWELPPGQKFRDGGIIEVKSNSDFIAATVIEASPVDSSRVSRDDETQKVITVISTAAPPPGCEEDTVRVSYAKQREVDANSERSSNKMPFAQVRPSEEPLPFSDDERLISERRETNPGQFARHSLASPKLDSSQPQYAVPIEEDIGWEDLMDDDRPTREVPVYQSKPSTETWQPKRETSPVPPAVSEVPQAVDTRPFQTQLADGDEDLGQDGFDSQEERYFDGRRARISVQTNHQDQEPTSSNSIIDEPISLAPTPISLAPPGLHVQMAEKFEMGDFSGALDIADQLLQTVADDIDAVQYRKSCRDRLLKMYESRIGDMDNIPRLTVSNHELMWRNLDSAAGFILSRIDEVSTYENILDISGMPKFETCRILAQLLHDGLID